MKLTSSSAGFEVEVLTVTVRRCDQPAPPAGTSMGVISADEIATLKLDQSQRRRGRRSLGTFTAEQAEAFQKQIDARAKKSRPELEAGSQLET